jgi:hypothetical protein
VQGRPEAEKARVKDPAIQIVLGVIGAAVIIFLMVVILGG